MRISLAQCDNKQGSYLLRLVNSDDGRLVLQTRGSYVE